MVGKEVLSRRTEEYRQWVEAFARNHGFPMEWTEPRSSAGAPIYRILTRQRSRFTHYYLYMEDEVLGAMSKRIATLFPFHTFKPRPPEQKKALFEKIERSREPMYSTNSSALSPVSRDDLRLSIAASAMESKFASTTLAMRGRTAHAYREISQMLLEMLAAQQRDQYASWLLCMNFAQEFDSWSGSFQLLSVPGEPAQHR